MDMIIQRNAFPSLQQGLKPSAKLPISGTKLPGPSVQSHFPFGQASSSH